MKSNHQIICVDTEEGISIFNITDRVKALVASGGIENGFVMVSSRHTTTAITVNEDESRLRDDIKAYFSKLVPTDEHYLHNDIHLRNCAPDEPENAHAHLLAILLGNSEYIPLVGGELSLGRWQSVMVIELDGPRQREIAIQICGE